MGITWSRLASGALGALIAIGGALAPAQAALRNQAPAPVPVVNGAALHSQGRLAFLWNGDLYVVDGNRGTVRQIAAPGLVANMTWSPDGQWLAYIQPSTNGAGEGSVWMARAASGQPRRVNGLPASVFFIAWAPLTDALAAVTDVVAPARGRTNGLWLVAPTGGARRLVTGTVDTVAWAPDGKRLAYSVGQGAPSFADALYTMPAGGGRAIRRFVTPNAGIRLAGWWPDGKGVLFWPDPDHSGSIAADGMALYTLRLGGAPRLLTTTLGHSQWLSWAPAGDDLLAIAGDGREIWHGKAPAICDVVAATCRVLSPPPGSVALDPAWAPDGAHLAYIVARDAGSIGGFGSAQANAAWVHTRTLWIAAPSGAGAHPLPAACQGIYQPAWSRDGRHLLYLRDDTLWQIDSRGGAPVRIVGPFPQAPSAYPYGYYGYLSWSDILAWYQG